MSELIYFILILILIGVIASFLSYFLFSDNIIAISVGIASIIGYIILIEIKQ